MKYALVFVGITAIFMGNQSTSPDIIGAFMSAFDTWVDVGCYILLQVLSMELLKGISDDQREWR